MTGESRTAAPSAPGGGAAVVVFGARLAVAERFADHLATSAVERGLIGPREVPRLWERHLLNCAVVAELIGPGERCVDVGSGAGLPGVVLAIARPDLSVTLVEPLQRRVSWLTDVLADLALGNVEVVRARAEELHPGGPRFDVALARAVAPLNRLAGWCVPLVVPRGRVLALKGRTAAQELATAGPSLVSSGVTGSRIARCGEGVLADPTTVVVLDVGVPAGGSAGRRARRCFP